MSEQIKAGYTTLLGAAKRIGIKRQTVEDWVILGILELEDGLVPLETVEKVREQDKKYISLESFLKNVKAERFNNKLYKHRELYLRYLWENKFWGFKTTKPNEVRYPFEKNVSLYFLRSDISSLREKSEDFFESFGLNEKEKCEWLIEKRCSSKKIKDLLVDYLKKIDSYTVTVTEFVRNALDVDFENYDMITEGRRIDELKYENSKVLLKDFTDKVAKKLKLGFIVDEPLGTKEEKPTKEISAYSREVYLGIIKEVFNEENIRKNGVLTKALDKSFYYETWHFLSTYYVCGWRAIDICLNWPSVDAEVLEGLGIQVDTLKQDIVEDKIPEAKLIEICKAIVTYRKLHPVRPHKTKKKGRPLVLSIKERSNKIFFGRMALISYYHQTVSGEGRMQYSRIKDYLNRNNIKELFGDRMYNIIGKRNLRSRRLTKSFLQRSEILAIKNGKNGFEASAIASYYRSHKDTDSIVSYTCDHGYDGLTPEVVLSFMLDRGVFGSLLYKEFLMAFPDAFRKLTIQDQTLFMAHCGVSAYEMEIMCSDYSAQYKLKQYFCNGEKEKASTILKAMFEISQGRGMSKDEGVFCKKRAIGVKCIHDLFGRCIPNACQFMAFTEEGIGTLVQTLAEYEERVKLTGNPKDEAVLKDVLIPEYKEIMMDFMNWIKATNTEEEAIKKAIGEYYEKYSHDS